MVIFIMILLALSSAIVLALLIKMLWSVIVGDDWTELWDRRDEKNDT